MMVTGTQVFCPSYHIICPERIIAFIKRRHSRLFIVLEVRTCGFRHERFTELVISIDVYGHSKWAFGLIILALCRV